MVLPRRTVQTPVMAVLAILLLASLPAAAVQTLPAEDRLPQPLFGYGAAKAGENAYLFGGARGNEFQDTVVQVRPTGASAEITTMPRALKEPAAAAIGGSVYIFGGADQGSSGFPTTTDTIFTFDPDTGQVEDPVGQDLPYTISSASAVRVGAYIYIFGGLTLAGSVESPVVDYRDTILRFDPGSGDVQQMSTRLPTGRAQMTSVVHQGSVLLFGGMGENSDDGQACPETDDTVCFHDDIYRFTPQGTAGSLDRIGELPQRLRWAASAVVDGQAYVLGGCQNNCGTYYGVDNITQIDPSTGSATDLPVRMPAKGGQRQALLFDQTAFLPGGIHPNPEFPENSSSARVADDRVHRVELGATRPWAPAGLEARAAQGSGVALSWQAPTYDGGSPLTSYEVHRSRGLNDPIRVAEISPGQTSYTDKGVELGTTYTYTVVATNRIDVSPASNQAVFTPTATPSAPDLTAQGGDQRIVAQWSKPAEAGGLDVDGYRLHVYEEGSQPQVWAEITGRYAAVNAVTDDQGNQTPVENGKAYVVRVQAGNDNGWGALSDPVTVHPAEVPDEPGGLALDKGIVQGQPVVNLTWDPVPGDVDRYAVYRGTSLANLEKLAETDRVAFTDDEVPQGTELFYGVSSLAGDQESPISKLRSVAFARPPGNVTELAAIWTGSHVTVEWQLPEDTGGAVVEAYEVARTQGVQDPEAAGSNISRVEAAPYRDGDPPRGTSVLYHVRALGPGGAGPWSMVHVRVPLSADSARPQPVLSANPSNAKVGQTVTFDGSGSSDDEGVVAYRFTFGDGASSGWTSSPSVQHVYAEPGAYTVTLDVRDLKGLTSKQPAQVSLAVGPAPGEPTEDPPEPTGEPSNGAPLPAMLALTALAVAAWLRRR